MFNSKRSGRANIDAELKSFPFTICVDCVCACMYTHTHTQRLTSEQFLRHLGKVKMNYGEQSAYGVALLLIACASLKIFLVLFQMFFTVMKGSVHAQKGQCVMQFSVLIGQLLGIFWREIVPLLTAVLFIVFAESCFVLFVKLFPISQSQVLDISLSRRAFSQYLIYPFCNNCLQPQL